MSRNHGFHHHHHHQYDDLQDCPPSTQRSYLLRFRLLLKMYLLPIPKDATSSSVSSNDELFRKLVQLRAMFRNDSTNGNKDDDDRESLARELEKEKMRVANLEAEIVGLRKLRTREECRLKKASSAQVHPCLHFFLQIRTHHHFGNRVVREPATQKTSI